MEEQSILIRSVIQRTSFAEVKIHGNSQGQIQNGLLILFGLGFSTYPNISEENREKIINSDESLIVKNLKAKLEKLAEKILALRIFADSEGKMNLSIKDIAGGLYVVSQFTLFADCRKGNRPSFTNALKPNLANAIYEEFVRILKEKSINLNVFTGKFGENMAVSLCNNGPVTLILEV